MVLAWECDKACAQMLCARLNEAIAEHNSFITESHLNMSLSFGFAFSGEGPASAEALSRQADERMYFEKRKKKGIIGS